MPNIVIQDDKVIRAIQVILDPDTAPARQAAFADYYSVDVDDFLGWCERLRERIPEIVPSRIVNVANQEAFEAALGEADGAVVESLRFGEEQLAKAPNIRIIHKFGTDVRNIDRAACEKRGVAVATLRRRVNVAVAEHAFALLLALAKKICLTDKHLTMESLHRIGFPAKLYDTTQSPGSNWARVSGLRTLQGATLGVLGLGEIGREMAGRAGAFGMKVLYHQRNRLPQEIETPLGARHVSLDELLSESDFISVHLPMDKTTENLIDAAAFAKMKPGAMLVNISRAHIVNREALLAALESGRLGGAAFDVHYKEPGDADDPLLAFPNVVLTPHTAVATRELGALDMEEMVGNFARVLG